MSKIILAGTVRNSSSTLKKELEIVLKSFKNHNIQKICLIESDSTDNTVEIIKQLARTDKRITYKSLGTLEKKISSRPERIAYCRNEYMKLFEKHAFFDADHLFVSDLDGTNTLLTAKTVDAILRDLSKHPKRAATANQLYRYYDIWALRHPQWCPSDCWYDYHLSKDNLGKKLAHFTCNESKMLHLDQKLAPIKVESAFGGCAIYSTSALDGCRYRGIKNKLPVCEHVYFSEQYRKNGGSIFIYPNFINHNKSEHVLNAEKFNTLLKSKSMVHF